MKNKILVLMLLIVIAVTGKAYSETNQLGLSSATIIESSKTHSSDSNNLALHQEKLENREIDSESRRPLIMSETFGRVIIAVLGFFLLAGIILDFWQPKMKMNARDYEMLKELAKEKKNMELEEMAEQQKEPAIIFNIAFFVKS